MDFTYFAVLGICVDVWELLRNVEHYVVEAQRNGKRLLRKYCKLLFTVCVTLFRYYLSLILTYFVTTYKLGHLTLIPRTLYLFVSELTKIINAYKLSTWLFIGENVWDDV